LPRHAPAFPAGKVVEQIYRISAILQLNRLLIRIRMIAIMARKLVTLWAGACFLCVCTLPVQKLTQNLRKSQYLWAVLPKEHYFCSAAGLSEFFLCDLIVSAVLRAFHRRDVTRIQEGRIYAFQEQDFGKHSLSRGNHCVTSLRRHEPHRQCAIHHGLCAARHNPDRNAACGPGRS
jgi:hypothetical protein